MTLTQEILDAIREAPETVEWRLFEDLEWHSYTLYPPTVAFNSAIRFQWRIKPKPYEARHEIYLSKTPEPLKQYKAENLMELLLGSSNSWYQEPITEVNCNKRYEIIVREMPE